MNFYTFWFVLLMTVLVTITCIILTYAIILYLKLTIAKIEEDVKKIKKRMKRRLEEEEEEQK